MTWSEYQMIWVSQKYLVPLGHFIQLEYKEHLHSNHCHLVSFIAKANTTLEILSTPMQEYDVVIQRLLS